MPDTSVQPRLALFGSTLLCGILSACTVPPAQSQTAAPRAAGKVLAAPPPVPDIDTEAVFKSLAPPKIGGSEPYHFKELRTPPRPNETELPFPPPNELHPPPPERPVFGPLAVTRHQPDGPQGEVGAVSVTFNQPMVPLASLEELKAKAVPLEIEPLPPGRFRWLGTTTVEFQPEGRMPYSTSYTVRIPAGAKSEAGRTLDQPVQWTFETPRASVDFTPGNGFSGAVPDQLIQLSFNQAVTPAAVREALQCTAKGKAFPLAAAHPATDPFKNDTAADVMVRRKLFEERNVFVRPASPLPLDAEIVCALPAGFRGSEGPLPTTASQTVTFRTYPPLEFVKLTCGWGERCLPGGGITAAFNNELDEDQDLAALVHVTPEVADLAVTPQGDQVVLQGDFKASTTYHIRIDARLQDVHKQRLKSEAKGDVQIGEAEPELTLGGGPSVLLEAVGPRVIPLHSTNVQQARLRWYKIEPTTLIDLGNLYFERGVDPLARLTAVQTRTVDLGKRDNASAAKGLSVDELLGKGKPGLLMVDIDSAELARFNQYAPTHRWKAVQVTDLGVTAHVTDEKAIVLITSLSTGKPVPEATASLLDGDGKVVVTGVSDKRGIVELPGPAEIPEPHKHLILVASRLDDRSVVLFDEFRTGSTVSSYTDWGRVSDHKPTLTASVFTDRQPYRPGDTVHVTGIARVSTHGVAGRIEPLPAGAQVKYVVTDSRGGKTSEGTVAVGPLGVFSVELKIAPDAFLGRHTFAGVLQNAGPVTNPNVATGFDVEEYRTPEYKVSVDTGEAPHFVGETLHGKVVAEYFFGGAMSGANASWAITRSKGTFTPPGNPGYSFADAGEIQPVPMWNPRRRWQPPTESVGQGSGTLDANGALPIETLLDPAKLKGPVSFQIQASVTDANRQQISASGTVLAHAGAWYPGLKIDRSVVKEGETVGISAITADIDGQRQQPPTSVELAEKTWERVKHPKPAANEPAWSYEEKEQAVSGCELAAPKSPDGPATCQLKIPKAGNYIIRVRAKDPKGRENVSSVVVWAFGKGFSPWFHENQQPSVELVADKPEHAPGESARILIRSPFPRSVGILAVQREGLIEYRALDFEGSAHGEELALTEAEVPNVQVMVSLVRGRISAEEAGAPPGDPDDAGRPMYAGGTLDLPISRESHAVRVVVTTAKPAIEPGSKLELKVHTTGGEGQPLHARMVIAIVDEGVLSLLGYALPNPLQQIFAARPGEGGDVSNVPLVLPREQKLTRLAGAPSPRKNDGYVYTGGAAFGTAAPSDAVPRAAMMKSVHEAKSVEAKSDDNAAPTLTARTLFASTAYFSADQQSDSNGDLALSVAMPENLTRYRIMVVAVADGERFGEGDGSVQIRKPILLRPALPRFLNLGDKFLASAVINNQSDADLWVDAQARAANGTVDTKRQRVLVRAGQAQEVAFEASAGLPGISRWQFAAVALSPERWNDAAELNVPVQLPATAEAFATYGTTEKSVLQPLQLPADALPDFGGLEVSMSSTALTGLTDAVAYLYDYPYECVEQTASRILPFIVLRKIITDFHFGGAETQAERDKLIKDGLHKIWAKQRPDGGFGYWSDSTDSYLYVSAWAAYVVARAQAAGYPSDAGRLQRLKSFLQQRLSNPRHDLGEDLDYSSQAMAALVLTTLDVKVPALIQRIYGHHESLPLFGKAWLMEAAHLTFEANSTEEAELNRELQSAAVEKASSAHFAEATTESIRLLMHSSERTDAIVLDAFLRVRPNDPLIPKIAHGLSESRTRGRWDTTQSNAWGTLAMSDYYDVFEKVEPEFKADIFVGNGFVGEGQFSGRETKILTQKVPFAAIAEQKQSDVILSKEGAGRLYYRLGLRYAPKSLKLAPEEQGFTVTRTYLPMPDAPETVNTSVDGSVTIKAGSEVRVTLQIVVPDRADFVAVDDPLPAGLEAVNTAFLTNQSSRLMDAQQTDVLHRRGWRGWWWSPFNHTEMRDDRVALFADRLDAGVFTHTYVARATTKGTFQVPPMRAFEMYEPENFGRTGSVVVTVQ